MKTLKNHSSSTQIELQCEAHAMSRTSETLLVYMMGKTAKRIVKEEVSSQQPWIVGRSGLSVLNGCCQHRS
jgi:hypothetical protein